MKKTFGEDCQVVIATHCDKSHLHNHIILNTYSITGRKFNDNKTTRNHVREYSDRVCLAFGIQPIQKNQGDAKSIAFVKWEGSPVNPQTPYGWLKEFCEKNSFPFYGIHQFRHLHTSLLIGAGIDPTTVSGILGHAQVSTTLNVYSHQFQNAQARVSEAMDGAFRFLAKKKSRQHRSYLLG